MQLSLSYISNSYNFEQGISSGFVYDIYNIPIVLK